MPLTPLVSAAIRTWGIRVFADDRHPSSAHHCLVARSEVGHKEHEFWSPLIPPHASDSVQTLASLFRNLSPSSYPQAMALSSSCPKST